MLAIHYNKVEKVHKVMMREKWLNIKINACKVTRKINCLISR